MININIDIQDLLRLGNLPSIAKEQINGAVADLAKMTHAKLIEEANSKLKTRRQAFIDNLTYFEVDKTTWLISLDASARWINDGQPAHNMLDDLLNGPKAKVGQNGLKYVNVPFDKSPGLGKTGATPSQADLISTIKMEMKRKNIPFAKIEKNGDGSDKMGFLHSFDIINKPVKTAEGVGQGHGPIGDVKQGHTGISFLQGVRVYQNKETDKEGKEFTKRSIFTFRVASEAQKDRNMWNHPGNPKTDIFEDTVKWLHAEWDNEIMPQLIKNIKKGI